MQSNAFPFVRLCKILMDGRPVPARSLFSIPRVNDLRGSKVRLGWVPGLAEPQLAPMNPEQRSGPTA